MSSLINLGYTHKILDIKCLEPSARSPLSGIAQGQKAGFFFLRLMMQKQERSDIFPQLAFSHATTLFQERCKNPKGNYLKKKKHKLFKISKPVFNFPPHCSQHGRSYQWSEKGNKRGAQPVPFLQEMTKYWKLCHLQFSFVALLIHVQLWGVKSHSKTKLLE